MIKKRQGGIVIKEDKIIYFFSGDQGVEPLCITLVQETTAREALKEMRRLYGFAVNGGLIRLPRSWEGTDAERTLLALANHIRVQEEDEDLSTPVECLLVEMFELGRKPGRWRSTNAMRSFENVLSGWGRGQVSDMFMSVVSLYKVLIRASGPRSFRSLILTLCRLAFQAGRKYQKKIGARKRRRRS